MDQPSPATEPSEAPAPADQPSPASEPSEAPAAGPTLDLDAVATDLAAVEAALARLDEGTYGRCEACGGPIDDETLQARPAALTCAAHLPTL